MKRGTVASPAQIVPSQGVVPKLDPHQAIGAGSPLCCLVPSRQRGRSAAGVFFPPFSPITEAAKVRRPLF